MQTKLRIAQIKPDPKNPRQEFPPTIMSDLESSILKYGIMSPVIVEDMGDGNYLLVDGERRYRTALKLGLQEIPATIMDEPLTEMERLIKRFHIQEQHESWSTFEKAHAITLLHQNTGYSVSALADTLGMSSRTVEGYLLASTLSKRVGTFVREKKLPFDWLRELAKMLKGLQNEDMRADLEEALLLKIQNQVVISSRELRKYALAIKKGGLKITTKIIHSPTYTPTQALADSGADIERALESVRASASFIASNGKRLLSIEKLSGRTFEVDVATATMFRKANKVLSELLKFE